MRYVSLFVLGLGLALVLSLNTAVSATESTKTGFSATGAKPGFVNPRVSTRTIALNQSVSVIFNTLTPQIDGVDPARVIRNALTLPSVQRLWRLSGEVSIEIDTKINSLRGKFFLIPRKSGTFPLPTIPLKWLRGNTYADFGKVTVLEGVSLGTELLKAPKEMLSVSGYVWGTSFPDLAKEVGKDKISNHKDTIILTPKPGLQLEIMGNALAAAQITADRLSLQQARSSFMQRWGDPIEEDDHRVTWIAGWVRITASTDGAGTLIRFVHEEMEERFSKLKVKNKVFDLLEGNHLPVDSADAEENMAITPPADDANATTRSPSPKKIPQDSRPTAAELEQLFEDAKNK